MKFKVGDIVRRLVSTKHTIEYGIVDGDIGIVIEVREYGSIIVRYFKGPTINNSHTYLERVKPNEQ
jgi:predicted RNA-binding protein